MRQHLKTLVVISIISLTCTGCTSAAVAGAAAFVAGSASSYIVLRHIDFGVTLPKKKSKLIRTRRA